MKPDKPADFPDAVVIRCALQGTTVVSMGSDKAGKLVLHFPASEYANVTRLVGEMSEKDLLATFLIARPRNLSEKR